MSIGTAILVHGKTNATILSIHRGGKSLKVLTDAGATTFIKASNATVAA